MNTAQKVPLFLLRISLGWMFFYAGITKVLDPSWTSKAYISGAKLLPELYAYLLQPNILPLVDLANKWGLTLIGIALIIGFWSRVASLLGVVLMILYYIPILDFPHPNTHSYIVDEHVVYICALLVLAGFNSGKVWGLGSFRK